MAHGCQAGLGLDCISLRRDSEALLKALGWYREGKNAGSPYYRFLAHWNALEAVYYGPASRDGRAAFLDCATPALPDAWTAYALPPSPPSPSEHFYEASRDAIAQVFRGEGGTRPGVRVRAYDTSEKSSGLR